MWIVFLVHEKKIGKKKKKAKLILCLYTLEKIAREWVVRKSFKLYLEFSEKKIKSQISVGYFYEYKNKIILFYKKIKIM